MAIGVGVLMPPVGLGYIDCTAAGAPVTASMRPSWIYNAFLLAGVALVPSITLWLRLQFGLHASPVA